MEGVVVSPSSKVSWEVEDGLVSSLASLDEEGVEVTW